MKSFKVICPHPEKEDLPSLCRLYAGIEIYGNNEKAMPPHAEGCHCYLEFVGHGVMEENVGSFNTGVEQVQVFPRNDSLQKHIDSQPLINSCVVLDYPELPRCACTNCEKCGQTNWVYKGKLGCGNTKCEDYAMDEANKMYADSLKDIDLSAIDKKKLAKWFEKPLGKFVPGIFSTRHRAPQPHLFKLKFESGLTDEQCEKINKQVREMTKGGDWKEPVFLNIDCEVIVEPDHATWLKNKRAIAKKELKKFHRKQLGLKHSIQKMEKKFAKFRKMREALANHCVENHKHPGDPDVDLSIEYNVLFNDFDASVRTLKHLRAYIRKSKRNAKRITELQHGLKTNFTTILIS